jgi:hypothetical protein
LFVLHGVDKSCRIVHANFFTDMVNVVWTDLDR